MTGPFVLAELRSRARMVGGTALGAFALLFVVTVSYGSLGLGTFGHAFANGEPPRGLSALSGSHGTSFLTPDGWVGFGFDHPMFLVLTLTVAIAVGAGAIAGEVDTGRAELLFVAPVARSRFVVSALVVLLAAELAVLAAALGGATVGGAFSSQLRAAGLGHFVLAPLQYLPLALAVATGALWAGATSPTRGRALGLAVGATVTAYLLNVVAGLVAALDWLRWVTPFGYYEPGSALAHGFDVPRALALLALSAVFLALALRGAERRDLA
jgi:ABC-2 type transport system permease protein